MSGVCKYIQVQPDDGCWGLANRCGISQETLVKYNPSKGFCDNLILDQYVCCSTGSLPDFSPKPDNNGNCYVYTVQSGDICSEIGKSHKMDPLKIPDYNHLTWAWLGCDNLQEGAKICLSKGNPPFPSPVEGVDCGPQKPGTKKPEKSSPWDWAKLNQCPLNACCNKWGFCGITPEFCTNTTAPGGAPGTAKNGTNGCLSNCGTKVKQASSPINTPRRIGYFEAWNLVRPCANMDISKMTDGDYYTHVHWSFGNITNNWEVDVSGLQEQFDGLKKLEDIKRILSFGGWGFSTEPYTHHIFRQGIQNGNRQILATNVVDFIIKHDLDGVDFDWEYPGAQDIPGVPPDRLDSGKNYAEFLKLVRNQLPKDKSISMALPASYWYLKGFHPVTQYEDYIDYYVYMTYDLHGQWDYGNTFVNEGCPNGNCLRSHVNKTETEYTLAMVTKAGIPSTKIVPGLALYGRSFKMTSPNCKEPGCTFIGEESGATKGACTETAGYLSNIEIFGLINEGNSLENYNNVTIEEYEDEGDILIYNKDQWVAWLKPESYDARKDWYDGMNFGGSVDWAVDLNRTYSKGGTGDLEEPEEDWPGYELCPETVYESLDDLQSAQKAGDVPDSCVPHMTLDTIGWLMDAAYNDYEDVNNGYDEVFDYYVDYIEKVVPAVLTNAFMWNLSISEPETWPEQGYGMEYFDCHFNDEDDWLPCSPKEWYEHGWALDNGIGTDLRVHDDDEFAKGVARAGLLEDWVDFGDYFIRREFGFEFPQMYTRSFDGWPVRNESMVVQNPKDIVTKGLPNMPKLRKEVRSTMVEVMAGQWVGGDARDAALAYAPALFMLQSAVDSMKEAKALGEKEEEAQEEEERKRKANLIVTIISAVLVIVPVVGVEVAAGLGFANLARIIAIAGEFGNAALATYDTVENPESAVVNILGSLFGVGGLTKAPRTSQGLGDIAKWRKNIKGGELSSLTKIYRDGDEKIMSILGKVCKI